MALVFVPVVIRFHNAPVVLVAVAPSSAPSIGNTYHVLITLSLIRMCTFRMQPADGVG